MATIDEETKTLCDWIYKCEGTLCNTDLQERVKTALVNQHDLAIQQVIDYLRDFVDPKIIIHNKGSLYSFGLILELMQKHLTNN